MFYAYYAVHGNHMSAFLRHVRKTNFLSFMLEKQIFTKYIFDV